MINMEANIPEFIPASMNNKEKKKGCKINKKSGEEEERIPKEKNFDKKKQKSVKKENLMKTKKAYLHKLLKQEYKENALKKINQAVEDVHSAIFICSLGCF